MIVQNLPVPFDRRVWLEATSLQSRGYQVTVICPKMRGYNDSHEVIEDVEIFRYPMPIDPSSRLGFIAEFAWAWLATFWLSLRVFAAGRGFDIIHACNPPETYWLLGRIWKLLGKRFIFDHHDLSPEMYVAKFGGEKGLLYRLLLLMERWTFKTSDVALATNESHRTIAIERGEMDPESVFVVRSGPDLGRLVKYDPDPSWSAGKKHLIAYLGDIAPQDGVDCLVRVASELRDKRDDFHCLVVGGGSAWESVRSYAREKGVADLFTFTGVVSDEVLCRALSSATIAVDPAPKNPWSDKSTMNKIMEYMFFGLPIVAFDLSETRESARQAAKVAVTGTDSEFAEIIDQLLDDPQTRAHMSETGETRLHKSLSWDHSVPNLMDAYERATNGHVTGNGPKP